jgi:mannose-6-phosphate isomerase-like protein (cupin superfamily)
MCLYASLAACAPTMQLAHSAKNMLHFLMRKSVTNSSRRSFLRTAPLAAAAGLAFTDTSLLAQPSAPPATTVPFQLFSADKLAEAMKQLQSKPGNDNLFQPTQLPFTIVLTTEQTKSAKEFEWHEGRDHILQVLDGTTTYELGGTPQGAHSAKPQEWNAPASSGATKLTVSKGDMLVIPRNTPHKRSTEASVTFYLISTTGTV